MDNKLIQKKYLLKTDDELKYIVFFRQQKQLRSSKKIWRKFENEIFHKLMPTAIELSVFNQIDQMR